METFLRTSPHKAVANPSRDHVDARHLKCGKKYAVILLRSQRETNPAEPEFRHCEGHRRDVLDAVIHNKRWAHEHTAAVQYTPQSTLAVSG